MTNWNKKIKVKHLLTGKEDYKSIQDSMSKIADVLGTHFQFIELSKKMRKIPKGDDFFKPHDYANKLLEKMYDIADYNGVWIE